MRHLLAQLPPQFGWGLLAIRLGMADLDFVVVEVRGDLVRGSSWIRGRTRRVFCAQRCWYCLIGPNCDHDSLLSGFCYPDPGPASTIPSRRWHKFVDKKPNSSGNVPWTCPGHVTGAPSFVHR